MVNTENNLSKYYVWDYVAWAFWKNKHIYNNLKITYIEEELNIQNNILAVNNLSSLNIYPYLNLCNHNCQSISILFSATGFCLTLSKLYKFCVHQSCPLKNSSEGTDRIVRTRSFWWLQVIFYQEGHLRNLYRAV